MSEENKPNVEGVFKAYQALRQSVELRLPKLSKKNLNKLVHILLNYPLQDEVVLSTEMQEMMQLCNDLVYNKNIVVRHLNDEAERQLKEGETKNEKE